MIDKLQLIYSIRSKCKSNTEIYIIILIINKSLSVYKLYFYINI